MSVRREKVRDRKTGAETGEERFLVDVDLQLPDGSRRRVRRVAPIATMRAAVAFERQLRAEVLAGRVDAEEEEEVPAPTLREFAPRWIEGHAEANRQKFSTIRSKRSILEHHLLPRLGDRRLDELREEDIARLKGSLASRSPKTVNNVLTVLAKLLKVAVRWGELAELPVRVELVRAPAPSMQFYEEAEFEQLVVGARTVGPDALLVVLLGGEAGLRAGEMIGLEWADVSLPARALTVRRTVWRGVAGAPKSGKPRSVPLTARLVEALRAARHLRGVRVLARPPGRGAGTTPRPYTLKSLQLRMEAATVAAKLPKSGGVHVLRHTFCSRLAMRGATAKAIQELAGHADLSTTQRYLHLSPAARGQAIGLLEPTPTGAVSCGLVREDEA